jgi:hypothetical protein
VHLEVGLDNYKKGIRTFLVRLVNPYLHILDIETNLWSDYTLLIEMLADATPEVAATLGDLFI